MDFHCFKETVRFPSVRKKPGKLSRAQSSWRSKKPKEYQWFPTFAVIFQGAALKSNAGIGYSPQGPIVKTYGLHNVLKVFRKP